MEAKKKNKVTEVKEFLNPARVYIPLTNYKNKNCKCLAKKEDKVKIGSLIGIDEKMKFPIYSSISGTVIGIRKMPYLDGETVNCVIVENDFKEATKKIKANKKLDKQTFVKFLKDSGIIGMGGSGFPTYIKYETAKPIKKLLINAVECEPYLSADYIVLKNNTREIIKTIKKIMKIMNIESSIIAINADNEALHNKITKLIGKSNIEVVEVKDEYPNGWERKLIKLVYKKNYKELPIEKGIIVNNVSTIYSIYRALEFEKGVDEKIITINGDIDEPFNIKLKIGTLFSDLNFESKGKILIAGGPMMGVSIKKKDLVVSKSLTGILLLNKPEPQIETACVRCGKCANICPVGIAPVLIKENINDIEKLRKLHPEKCIECGLCSYICPANIDLREIVKKAKERVK